MSSAANTQRLKELMSQYKLSIADVAVLLGRSQQTVKEWRCQNAKNISTNNLQLLELKLASRPLEAAV